MKNRPKIKNSTILVTGGAGFIGSHLFSLKFVYIFFGRYFETKNTLTTKVVFDYLGLLCFFCILNKKDTFFGINNYRWKSPFCVKLDYYQNKLYLREKSLSFSQAVETM